MIDAFICDAIRTPIGRFGGALKNVRADDLGAVPLRALMERNPQVDWSAVAEVLYGCANQAGEDNRNVARMAALLAGLVMLTRVSIKVRLAWSTVAQMGFMVLECGLGLTTLALLLP